MSVAIDCLAAAVNCCLGNLNLSGTEALKYMAAARSLETALESVKSLDQLPNAANNTGRIIYVESIGDYRYSDGAEWLLDFTSQSRRQIWSWGSNSSGLLGDGTTVNRSSPVSVVGGFTDWCTIAAGGGHSLAIRSNGTLWAWGCGNLGRLGDGTTGLNRTSPVAEAGGFTDWCGISAGFDHSLALRTNSTLWTWGSNSSGQLGINRNAAFNQSSPVLVAGGFTDWCAIAAGNSHSLAIRANGTAWSWGSNICGQLGDGTTTSRSSPVSVVGGITDWCGIAAGGSHNLALRANGTLWTWGSNSSGQLGHNTACTCARSSPVSIVGFINWSTVSAGDSHSLGLSGDTIWAWGCNGSGRLGDGTETNRSSPVSVIGGFTDWCGISAGDCHSAALRANGTVWSWGSNGSGQLGDGTTVSRSSPVSVIGGFTDWQQISVAGAGSTGIRLPRQGF